MAGGLMPARSIRSSEPTIGQNRNESRIVKEADNNLWHGLTAEARKALENKDYESQPLTKRIIDPGVMAGELVQVAADTKQVKEFWIPGVEIFPRKVFR